ncbi:MAG TPA: hypothetical protein VEQ58_16740 [Polyangiaceae bacterium]|nr:hypothetical protein [Polyangiaceae bacterium]
MATKTTKQLRSFASSLFLASVLLPQGIANAQSAPPPAPDAAKPSASETCSAAYERTQTEKLAGHYVAASAAALECSQLQCNGAIVKECLRFYEALEADTPTLVFSARKAEGGELTDVRVEMDGQLAAEQITGRPLAIDPGPHNFVFIHPQRGRLEVKETARVGDHARVLEVTFTDPNAKPAAPDAALAPPVTMVKGPRHVPVMSYVLGGVGVLGLGAFTYFRLSGVSDYNGYNSTCSPRCNPDDVDPVRKKFVYSYVGLGVGLASLAGAGLVFVFAPRRDSVPAVQAKVAPYGDGALAGVQATF